MNPASNPLNGTGSPYTVCTHVGVYACGLISCRRQVLVMYLGWVAQGGYPPRAPTDPYVRD